MALETNRTVTATILKEVPAIVALNATPKLPGHFAISSNSVHDVQLMEWTNRRFRINPIRRG